MGAGGCVLRRAGEIAQFGQTFGSSPATDTNCVVHRRHHNSRDISFRMRGQPRGILRLT